MGKKKKKIAIIKMIIADHHHGKLTTEVRRLPYEAAAPRGLAGAVEPANDRGGCRATALMQKALLSS